jgi:trehalose-phosphatase
MSLPLLTADDPASRRAAGADALVVAVDYDGTLARIVPDPADAVLVTGAAAALAALAAAPGTAAGVVTGRSLADVQARVALPGLFYAGNHGGELAWGARTVNAAADPILAPRVVALDQVAAALRPLVGAEPGALLEEKGLSLALHYRGVAAGRQASFVAAVARVLDRSTAPVERGQGKGVIEVRPVGVPGKAEALATLARWAADRFGRAPFLVYLGDDLNDEPALAGARAAGGLAVAVGERASEAATHRLADPESAAAWLAWLSVGRGGGRMRT